MRDNRLRDAINRFCAASLLLGMAPAVALAADLVTRSNGQTLYAAAYSHVLMGTESTEFPMVSTLVIRNTDPESPIVVTAVDYRDSSGDHLRHFVKEPVVIRPLASMEFVVPESDLSGGHSPSFITRWEASKTVNAPIVETLMIGGRGPRGISFVGRAWVIEETDTPTTEKSSTEPAPGSPPPGANRLDIR